MMNKVNLRDVIEAIWRKCERTFDSGEREDGWTATGRTRDYRYVAFNKYKGGDKVVYQVKRVNNGLNLRLFVSQKNQCVEEFRSAVKCNKERWFELSQKNDSICGVEKFIAQELDVDTIIKQVFDVLDDFYKKYNKIVSPKTKSASTVECLPLLTLNPRYDLSWKGWKDFYRYWDDFVENWYNSDANPDDLFTQALAGAFHQKNPNAQLDIRELPEPYYGHDEMAKCVIVHLNPGASDENEDTKIFGKNGKLITSFETDCDKKYSSYAKKWSSLRNSYDDYEAKKVPGYAWWHEKNRVEFIKRFLGVSDLATVFALEACPYHSKDWSGGLALIEEHIIDKVITPAAIVANRNNTCAVFVGSGFNEIIAKIKGVSAMGRWRGTRVYSLYKLMLPIEMAADQNRDSYVLVINGMQGMWLPAGNEMNIMIENNIHNIVQTGNSWCPSCNQHGRSLVSLACSC